MDASFVEVPRQRKTRAENALLKTGQTPADWSAKKRAPKDVDARWTQQHTPTYYGYKDHLKVNIQTKLIESAGGRQRLFWPARAGENGGQRGATVVVQNAGRGRALNETEPAENRAISRTRARVEQAFAVMRGPAGRIFQRDVGQARNPAAIQRLNRCNNLKRSETRRRLKLHPLAVACAAIDKRRARHQNTRRSRSEQRPTLRPTTPSSKPAALADRFLPHSYFHGRSFQ